MIQLSVFSCPVSYLHDPIVSLFLSCVIPTWSHCQSFPVLCHTYMIPLSVFSCTVLCHTYMIPLSVFSCTVPYLHDPTVSLFLYCAIPTWSHCQSFPVLCHTNMIELAAFSVLHLHDQDVGSFVSLSHLCNQDVGSFSLRPTYMIELSAVPVPCLHQYMIKKLSTHAKLCSNPAWWWSITFTTATSTKQTWGQPKFSWSSTIIVYNQKSAVSQYKPL